MNMDANVDNVAIVTGAAGGIGAATVRLFAERGLKVVLADLDLDAIEALAAELRAAGRDALAVRSDVSNEASVVELIEATLAEFGRLDIMFNNAGYMVAKKVVDVTEAEFDALFGVNVKGVFFGCKHAIPAMLQTGGGAIVNTGSISGVVGLGEQSIYCASKGAVHQFTRQIAADYADQGIRVNSVGPGAIDTKFLSGFYEGTDDPGATADAVNASIPIGRPGRADEIAEAVWFLATSTYTTGSILMVDGGYTAV